MDRESGRCAVLCGCCAVRHTSHTLHTDTATQPMRKPGRPKGGPERGGGRGRGERVEATAAGRGRPETTTRCGAVRVLCGRAAFT